MRVRACVRACVCVFEHIHAQTRVYCNVQELYLTSRISPLLPVLMLKRPTWFSKVLPLAIEFQMNEFRMGGKAKC